LTIGENELPDDMVETGSEIVDAISEYYGEPKRWFFFDPEMKDGPIRLIITSDEKEDISAQVTPHLCFKRIQVFFSSLEFRSNAIKWAARSGCSNIGT